MVHIYNTILLAIKKDKIMPHLATWINLEIIIVSEVSQRKISYNITYMWNLKKWDKWNYLQNRNRLSDFENKLWLSKGKAVGGNG